MQLEIYDLLVQIDTLNIDKGNNNIITLNKNTNSGSLVSNLSQANNNYNSNGKHLKCVRFNHLVKIF